MKAHLKMPNPEKAREFFEDKLSFTTGPIELERMLKSHDDINVVDVRMEEDYQQGHIPGAINLPKDKWDTFEGLRKDRTNILYCYSMVCHLAATAAVKFAAQGYPVMELEGGFDEWKEHGLDIDHQVNRGVSLNA